MRKLSLYLIALAMGLFVACGGDEAASEGDVQDTEMNEEAGDMEEAEEAEPMEEAEEAESDMDTDSDDAEEADDSEADDSEAEEAETNDADEAGEG